jgi:RHS repeat-associated protein
LASGQTFDRTNHLGRGNGFNVLAVVSDAKLPAARVLSFTDYYAFGGAMPGRSRGSYRYGFNGKENDGDFGNGQLIQDYGFRLYNPAIGKFLSVDPITASYPMLTPYQFASNSPISGVDMDGLEFKISIFSPDVSAKFKMTLRTRVNRDNDIYRQRELTYWALTHTFADGYALSKLGGNPANWAGQRAAVIKEDPNIYPPGVTVQMFKFNEDRSKIVEDVSFYVPPNKELPRPFDAYYPVDVKLVNENLYYGLVDFFGVSGEGTAATFYGESRGIGAGYLKGYGYIEYEARSKMAAFGGSLGASLTANLGVYRGLYTGTPSSFTGEAGAISSRGFFYSYGMGDQEAKSWNGFGYSESKGPIKRLESLFELQILTIKLLFPNEKLSPRPPVTLWNQQLPPK